jgi:hypothetical protein
MANTFHGSTKKNASSPGDTPPLQQLEFCALTLALSCTDSLGEERLITKSFQPDSPRLVWVVRPG